GSPLVPNRRQAKRRTVTHRCPPWRKAGRPLVASAPVQDLRFRAKVLLGGAKVARAVSDHAATPPSSVMNSRRFVCRESSILRGDGGSVMTVSPSRPEARRRFGSQTAN